MKSTQSEETPESGEGRSPIYRYHRLGRWRLRLRLSLRVLLRVLVIRIPGTLKRGFDLVLAMVMILVFLPLMTLIYLALKTGGRGLRGQEKLGKWNVTFKLLEFDIPERGFGRVLRSLSLHRLPCLMNILKGDIALVGPRILSPEEFRLGGPEKFATGTIRPGLITLWHIRRRANIDFEDAFRTDLEYIQQRSFLGDLGMALRMIPASVFGGGSGSSPDQMKLMGVRIDNLTMAETLDRLFIRVRTKQPSHVCFVNADCFNIAFRDPEYGAILNSAGLVLADGVGVKLAGKLLGQEIKQNVNGTDLFPRLCERSETEGARIYFLGARPGVAEKVVAWARNQYPELVVAGWHDGYFDDAKQAVIIDDIRASGADILLTAFGVPMQEKWIFKHLTETGVSIALGVGGLFDFYSGRISRAPVWMREIGMEWFYRFLQEPSRMWKRYFVGNGIFIWRVMREKFKRYHRQEG